MGFPGALLGMLAGSYILGIWAASTVLRKPQAAHEDGRRNRTSELDR